MALRPPRKCAEPGEGMVNLGVRFVVPLRKAKWSTMIGREQFTFPVTLRSDGVPPAAEMRRAGRGHGELGRALRRALEEGEVVDHDRARAVHFSGDAQIGWRSARRGNAPSRARAW